MSKAFPLILLIITKLSFPQNLPVEIINTSAQIHLDGLLDEMEWKYADSISLTMVEPTEGIGPSFPTSVKVLTDYSNIILGIKCFDPEPEKIVSFSKSRDALMSDEDRIKFVFDTYVNKRSGYIFAVNPDGTRYDALVSNFGESENPDWDGIWSAAAIIDNDGWSAEILIPIKTLSFSSETEEWGFNIERKIQRKLEVDRWTGIKRDYSVSQVVHAGRLTNIPEFDIGLGLVVKPSVIAQSFKSYNQKSIEHLDYSLDATEKFNPEITGQLTINTDFAETEIDARQINLTRFPLFFPEKRDFFLEGTDIFDFGIGLGYDVIPFFSRRIGLYEGIKVPILVGGKINGRINNTNFGALATLTDDVNGLVPSASMGAIRIKQNILEESSVGMIGTFGDPLGINNTWLLGGDFTYKTSKFLEDKNFLVGVWGLYNNNPLLAGDKTSVGIKIDYPNDLLDMAFTAKRIGDAFLPSVGFVPRNGVSIYTLGVEYMPRPDWLSIRQFFFEFYPYYVTDLNNNWESWEVFIAPIHFLLESGDRFEFNIDPQGENLDEDFEIEDGVIIKQGPYNWLRYRIEFESASKRIINGQFTWWFGSFYNGTLDQIELFLNLRPASIINIGLTYEKYIGHLPSGNFDQDIFGGRIQIGFMPDFELSSFIQYDNESKLLGTNTRLRWTFSMLGDLFIVYNHNVVNFEERRWRYESNQLILKLSYGFWF